MNSKKMITDIALDSGYDTSSSFAKAFTKVMGVSPKSYRDAASFATLIKRIEIKKKENNIMNPEIVTLDPTFLDRKIFFLN